MQPIWLPLMSRGFDHNCKVSACMDPITPKSRGAFDLLDVMKLYDYLHSSPPTRCTVKLQSILKITCHISAVICYIWGLMLSSSVPTERFLSCFYWVQKGFLTVHLLISRGRISSTTSWTCYRSLQTVSQRRASPFICLHELLCDVIV